VTGGLRRRSGPRRDAPQRLPPEQFLAAFRHPDVWLDRVVERGEGALRSLIGVRHGSRFRPTGTDARPEVSSRSVPTGVGGPPDPGRLFVGELA
jgi:hypothetical protein